MRRLLDVLSRVETLQEIVEGGVCSSLTKTSDMCGQRSAMLASFCSRRRVRHFSVERESRGSVFARVAFSVSSRRNAATARARKRRCSRTLVGSCGRVFDETPTSSAAIQRAAMTKREIPSVAQAEADVGWLQSATDRVARTWIGQAILTQLDTFLWIVEKSAEWSLPRNEGEESVKTDLVRPLPWMLFLPTLLILRMIRASLNTSALMFGSPRVSPTSMVRFVQKSRYRLSSIGKTSKWSEKTRLKRDTQDKRLSMNQAKKALIKSIRLTLSTLSCLEKPSLSPPPTRIHISALDLDAEARTKADESCEEESDEQKKHEEKMENGGKEHDESSKADSTKQIASSNTDDNCPERTLTLSQDSDTHFFSPVESSASRSRSNSTDSSVSNDTLRQSLSSISNISVQNSHQRSKRNGGFTTEQTASDRKIDATSGRCSAGRPFEETNNGAIIGKRGTNAGKYHRGKRTSHGNRKKK